MNKINRQKGIAHVILIFIGLFLILVVFGYFSMNYTMAPIDNNFINQNQNNNNNQNPNNTPLVCGLNLIFPKENTKISFPMIIKGVANGCGWVAFEGQIGTVEIVDNSGISVTALTPIMVKETNWMQLPVTFETIVNLKNVPISKAGFLIFRNDDPSGANPKVVTLPIKF
ncbi:MAG: hypothetical protein WDK96_00345 [Candidatus Paceibacterota bacterium]|jgi:hypothetical protein